ncbi:MAG: amylo-alpha-1,6-glucosidase [Myxococcales bacterium]|nr:amylo-alpha-1,6-glucosidase [Myxococcales bacterium]
MNDDEPQPGRLEDDVLHIQGEYYIRATSSRADDRTRVLKHGNTFGVFDRFGDVHPIGLGEQGLYGGGTRYLSRLELRIGARRPFLLSSNVREDNDVLTVDLTNPDLMDHGEVVVTRGSLHVQRQKFLWGNACHERLSVTNYSLAAVTTDLAIHFDVDFADIFEVRGNRRPARGRPAGSQGDSDTVRIGYVGLDDLRRDLVVSFSPAPARLTTRSGLFRLQLRPGAAAQFDLCFAYETGDTEPAPRPTFDAALAQNRREIAELRGKHCRLTSDSEPFNRWLLRSEADLQMMTSSTPSGPYPYAGVPWFSNVFGRDGLITAFETLWVNPELARGVLKHLAAHQAHKSDPSRDAQPGKILHEQREGEMCNLHEVPFGLYYGSVDATPLFVYLAGAYVKHTGDLDLADELWPHVERALDWIMNFGDIDGDGFVEYARQSRGGLEQQGWKDSQDSVFYEDGTIAAPPIALCEVQAYVHAAYRAAADLAHSLGKPARAAELVARAESLRARFDEAFWDDELGAYVLALDGKKRPCRVLSSNAGHALFGGIARTERVAVLVRHLMSDRMFSGWGLRTLARGEVRYNPMSYHNGSVWPHDNALVALGMARYGRRDAALQLLSGLWKASTYFDLHRLPELFCGFSSRDGEGPTLYPVACAPQAWAAGAVHMLLAACLGLSVEGARKTVVFRNPVLPPFINELRIEGLAVGGNASVDLLLVRHPHDVGVTVLARQGEVRILVER